MATKKNKTAQTGAARVAKSVKVRKDAGLIQAKVWVHPDEANAVRVYANKKPQTKAILATLPTTVYINK